MRERYPSREVYLSKVTRAALELQNEGFLLAEDVIEILNAATRRRFWDDALLP